MAAYGNLMDTINTELGRRYPDRRSAAGPQRSPALTVASKNVVAPDDEAAKLARFRALRDQIASRGPAGISPVNQALGAAPNPMMSRFAGGMSPAEAINPAGAQGPSLEDYQQPNSPFRTIGLPVNAWGQDATKAGDKYYSASPPPARTPPSNVQVSSGGMPVGMVTSKFDDHMKRVKAMDALRASPSDTVRAAAMQKAQARRDRLQTMADARRGISPQTRMQMDIMRQGGEANPLQMAVMGFPGLADQTIASKGLVDAAGRKYDGQGEDRKMLLDKARLQIELDPSLTPAQKREQRKAVDAIEAGGVAPNATNDPLASPDFIDEQIPNVTTGNYKAYQAFKLGAMKRGVTDLDTIIEKWLSLGGASNPGWGNDEVDDYVRRKGAGNKGTANAQQPTPVAPVSPVTATSPVGQAVQPSTRPAPGRDASYYRFPSTKNEPFKFPSASDVYRFPYWK